MIIIDFRAGTQIAGTIVRDMYGGLWTVLKNIGYATAQPREGVYYTRYTEVIVPPIVEEIIEVDLNSDDFYIDTLTNTIRIKR